MTNMTDKPINSEEISDYELCDSIMPGRKSHRVHGCIKPKGHKGMHCNGQNILWLQPRIPPINSVSPASTKEEN